MAKTARVDAFSGVDLVVFNNKVYVVNETSLPATNVLGEIKEYYEKRFKELKDGVESAEFNKHSNEWKVQCDHIENVQKRTSYAIPPDMTGTLVMLFKECVCECRIVRYKPSLVTSPVGSLVSVGRIGPQYSKVANFVANLRSDERVVIDINQSRIDHQVIFAFHAKTNMIYTPLFRGFHTMGGSELCTGNVSAKDFWANPGFNLLVNTVNLFSLATSEIVGVNYSALLTNDVVVNMQVEGLWRTGS